MGKADLELNAVIGFKGSVMDGLNLHDDGKHLIYPLGCTIVVRNVVDKTQTFLQGHDNEISCISISKSGKLMASGQRTHMGFSADVHIWDIEKREKIHTLCLHKGGVQAVHFSPCEKYVVTLGQQDDNALVVWDLSNGQAICGSPADNDTAHAAKFLNNDSFTIVTCGVSHIRVWEFDLPNKKLRPTAVATGATKRTYANILIDSRDNNAYIGTMSGELMEINLRSKKMSRLNLSKANFKGGVTATCLLKNGDVLAGSGAGDVAWFASDSDGNVRGSGPTAITKVLGGVTSITPTGDNSHFFVGTNQSNIYWVQLSNMEATLKNTCHAGHINQIVFPQGYSGVFATCGGSDIRLWDAKKRQELLRISVANKECNCIEFSRDGSLILSGWSDGKIRAFTPQSGSEAYTIHDCHANGVTCLASTSDGSQIISGGADGMVRVWDGKGALHSLVMSLKEHKEKISSVRVTKNDRHAVSASKDGSCIVWDLQTRGRGACMFANTSFTTALYFNDESQIITVGTDRKLTYWDAITAEEIRVREGSEHGGIMSMDCTAGNENGDGCQIVTVGEDKEVKVWDYDSGLCTHTGIAHSGIITCAAIAPDNSCVVTVGADHAIMIWNLPPASC